MPPLSVSGDCLSEEELDLFVRGGLVASGQTHAQSHLDSCAQCRQAVGVLAASRGTTAPSRQSGGAVRALQRADRVGRYELIEPLGEGAMGVVWSAQDPELQRVVALKFLRGGVLSEEERERLLREARALGRINHPNVITVYDVESSAAGGFIAMEHMEGGNLESACRGGRKRWDEVLRLYLAAGEGLVAAHKVGLVHRDFKPQNVLLGAEGRPRVADFGLVRASILAPAPAPDANVTTDEQWAGNAATVVPSGGSGSGALLAGTPAYMAPEQLVGHAATERSDQFSFCVSLYQGLFDRLPFDVSSYEKLRRAHAAPLDVPARPALPRKVERALRRGLSAKPSERFPSMEALLTALRPPANPRRLGITLAVAGCALVGVLVAVGLRQRQLSLCAVPDAELGKTWNPAVRAQLRASFEKSGLPFAADSAERVAVLLDGYTQSWARVRTESCVAFHVRGTESAGVHELRERCLTQRRDELRALTELLTQPGREVVTSSGAGSVVPPPGPPSSGVASSGAGSVAPPSGTPSSGVASSKAGSVAPPSGTPSSGVASSVAPSSSGAGSAVPPSAMPPPSLLARSMVTRSVEAARSLEPATVCALADELAPFAAPATHASAELRRELEAATVRARAFEPRPALAMLQPLVPRLRTADDAALLAEALVLQGTLAGQLSSADAVPTLKEAVWLSQAHHLDRWAYRASLELARNQTYNHPADAQLWTDYARASATHLHGTDAPFELALQRARLARTQEDDAGATQALADARQQLEAAHDEGSPRELALFELTASLQQHFGRDAEGALSREKVLELAERLYGPLHPETARALLDLSTAIPLGSPRKAETLRRALPILRGAYGEVSEEVGVALDRLGQALLGEKQAEQARAPALEAATVLARVSHGEAAHAYALGNLADVDLALRRNADARAELQEDVDITTKLFGEGNYRLCKPLERLARLALEEQRWKDADALARQALHAWENGPRRARGGVVPQAKLDLAEANLHLPGQAAAAQDFAAQALAEASKDGKDGKDGPDAELAARVREWLAQHPRQETRKTRQSAAQ